MGKHVKYSETVWEGRGKWGWGRKSVRGEREEGGKKRTRGREKEGESEWGRREE